MKRLLFLAALFLPLMAHATQTLVQHPNFACTNPCTVTVSATGANHGGIIVVTNDDGGSGRYVTGVTGAGTWVVPTGSGATACQAFGDAGAVSYAYNVALTGGVTSLTLTFNVSTSYSVQFWEYSSPDTFVFDACGNIVDNTGSANPWPGPSLTLSGSNDVIVTGEVTFNIRVLTISSPYGNLTAIGAVDWGADSENTNSGTAPSWSSIGGSSRNVGVSLALKDGVPLATGRLRGSVIRH